MRKVKLPPVPSDTYNIMKMSVAVRAYFWEELEVQTAALVGGAGMRTPSGRPWKRL